jgi:hypothetical protein
MSKCISKSYSLKKPKQTIIFLDGRPTGPALLKKQNVDWGYQFYRAATQNYKPGTKKRPERTSLKD